MTSTREAYAVLAASVRSGVPPFAVMSILNRVAQLRAAGREVISLCAGEPTQGAPSDVRRRAAELMVGRTPLGYSETFGIRPLRAELAGHYRRWYGLEVPEEQIALTTGSSGAFLLSFLAAFDAGDRVAMTRPGYPAYRNILASLGCEVVELSCGPEQRFQPTIELLECGPRRRSTGRAGGGLTRQSDRDHDRADRSSMILRGGARLAACGWSATRSTTGSPTVSSSAAAPGNTIVQRWSCRRSRSTGA